MISTHEQEKIKQFIDSFVEEGLNEQSAKSLLIKLYVLNKHGYLKTIPSIKQEVNFSLIIKNQDIFFAPLTKKLEIYKVSDFSIPLILLQDLREISNHISSNLFFSYLKDTKSSKLEGQFFTPPDLINQIYSGLNLPEETYEGVNFNILDCSAGIGDFLSIFIRNDKIFNYAVELDKLAFEFMLFDFLFDRSVSQTKKAKLILTLKQGDALKGYQIENVKQFLDTKNGKDLLLNYKVIRENLLNSKEISIVDIERALDLRCKISKIEVNFEEFNWFIDFPEIFFDRKLQLSTENVFDFVLGNPPWIKYGSFNISNYKKIFSHPLFANYIQGKFNFSLPFIILGYKFSKFRGALVIPKGVISETYASKWRKKIFNDKTLSEIILSTSVGFKDVINEYGLVFWDKEQKRESFQIHDEKSKIQTEVDFKSIKPPLFKIPLIPKPIYKHLEKVFEKSQPLKNFCEIRRGLTLSKKYQEYYLNKNLENFDKSKVKKLIRHNSFNNTRKEGIGNFQVFYGGEIFVYDKKLLGAPGSSSIFERSKIIRRNRGKQWLIGLDLSRCYYVNDIFDVIFSSDESTLFTIFGYLSSSLVQILMESYIQRDITSNLVRELPFPNLSNEELKKIEKAVNQWVNSKKTKDDIENLRNLVDKTIFELHNIPEKIQVFIQEIAKLHWFS